MVSSHFFNLIVWGFCSIIYKGEVRRMTDRTSSGQQKLEAHVAKTLQENNIQQKDLINGMMQADDAGCSFADKTITFAFPVQPWQANRAGHLHGGIICTAFDMTIAALARFLRAKTMRRPSVWTLNLSAPSKWEIECWLLQRPLPRGGGSPS